MNENVNEISALLLIISTKIFVLKHWRKNGMTMKIQPDIIGSAAVGNVLTVSFSSQETIYLTKT